MWFECLLISAVEGGVIQYLFCSLDNIINTIIDQKVLLITLTKNSQLKAQSK